MKDFTEEEKQQMREEGLIEIEPGIWGYVGERVEPGQEKDIESLGNLSGYWLIGN